MGTPTAPSPHDRFVAQLCQDDGLPWTVFEIGIPMRDGIELAADVYLPKGQPGPFPTVVEATPYDKAGAFRSGDIALYTTNGYAVVMADLRGRGKSEGEWRPFINDPADCHDIVEWAAAQEWSTGKIGMSGLSYLGWVQWAAASQHPPHLTAMISTSAAGRWQQEIPYTNGCFQLFFGWWVYAVRRRIREAHGMSLTNWDEVLRMLPLDRIGEFINPGGSIWEDLIGRDTLDDFWQSIRYDDQYDTFTVPCLHVTGWYDFEDLLGAMHHYEHMMETSPAHEQQRLIVGPWSHFNSRVPHHSHAGEFLSDDAAMDMDREHLQWFDYWLKGIDNGALATSPVRLYQPGSNKWRNADHWPLATRTETLALSFDGINGTLTANQNDAGNATRSYRYDPRDPAPTQIDIHRYQLDQVPLDQTAVEARADVLTYTTAPLKEELIISGWPHLHLWASSDCTDTEFHVKITDVDPEGRSMKVCQGCLRAACRNSLTDLEPLAPGKPYLFDIELWPIHHAILPGHSLRVSVTSSDFPWFARSLNHFGPVRSQAEQIIATNTIHHDEAHQSALILPVESGSLSA